MKILLVCAACLGVAACDTRERGYVSDSKYSRRMADKDPMVGPVRAYNARKMYDRLDAATYLGGPQQE